MIKKVLTVILLIAIQKLNAQDRSFTYTYTSDVLSKGSFDMEFWHTSRFGHASEYYHAMDQRIELEAGLGNRFQTAFYFNHYQVTKSDSANNLINTTEIGFSNEWKWKMSNVYTSSIGSALYAELGIKGDEIELETKLILDKVIGKHLIAFNLVGELSNELKIVNNKHKYQLAGTPIELDLAYMYNFNTDYGLGLEIRNANSIEKGNWENSVMYGGPTFNYRSQRWFVIASYLPQLVNLHKTADYPGNKVLDRREKNEARIIIGFSF